MNKNQWNEVFGGTPNTARQRRALPIQMNHYALGKGDHSTGSGISHRLFCKKGEHGGFFKRLARPDYDGGEVFVMDGVGIMLGFEADGGVV